MTESALRKAIRSAASDKYHTDWLIAFVQDLHDLRVPVISNPEFPDLQIGSQYDWLQISLLGSLMKFNGDFDDAGLNNIRRVGNCIYVKELRVKWAARVEYDTSPHTPVEMIQKFDRQSHAHLRVIIARVKLEGQRNPENSFDAEVNPTMRYQPTDVATGTNLAAPSLHDLLRPWPGYPDSALVDDIVVANCRSRHFNAFAIHKQFEILYDREFNWDPTGSHQDPTTGFTQFLFGGSASKGDEFVIPIGRRFEYEPGDYFDPQKSFLWGLNAGGTVPYDSGRYTSLYGNNIVDMETCISSTIGEDLVMYVYSVANAWDMLKFGVDYQVVFNDL